MFRRKGNRSRRPAILAAYVTRAPTPQNALDLFAGEWMSRLPGEHAELEAGELALFDDPRIHWGLERLGGVDGQRVLELGPLEAGHSSMLEQAGAASVTAVEANGRAYLKCLVVKEIVGLRRTSFLLGGAVEYLEGDPGRFDLVVASGVLYHMRDPLELIAGIARVTDRLLLWTHYFDADRITSNPAMRRKFARRTKELERDGFHTIVHEQRYAESLDELRFCGGAAESSHWMERDAILDALRHYGFRELEVGFEDLEHPNGPCFAVAAKKG